MYTWFSSACRGDSTITARPKSAQQDARLGKKVLFSGDTPSGEWLSAGLCSLLLPRFAPNRLHHHRECVLEGVDSSFSLGNQAAVEGNGFQTTILCFVIYPMHCCLSLRGQTTGQPDKELTSQTHGDLRAKRYHFQLRLMSDCVF